MGERPADDSDNDQKDPLEAIKEKIRRLVGKNSPPVEREAGPCGGCDVVISP